MAVHQHMDVAGLYRDSLAERRVDISRPHLYYGNGAYPDVERYQVVLELVDSLDLPAKARALDLSAGGGILTEQLAQRFDKVFATDITLTPAMRNCLVQFPNIRFSEATLPEVPFAAGVFDLVVFSEVIEHLPNSTDRNLGTFVADGCPE